MCRELRVSEQTYYRWRKEYGGTKVRQAKRLKGLEIFCSLEEAKVLIEQWRREYNTVRPHSSLAYRPPAPEAIRPNPKLLSLPWLLGPHPRRNEALGLTLWVAPLSGAGHYQGCLVPFPDSMPTGLSGCGAVLMALGVRI